MNDLLSRPLAELLDEHAEQQRAATEAPAVRRASTAKLRPIYELAVRLESHGAIEPDPRATEADMLVAIEYALATLADQRDRAHAARVQAEAFRDHNVRRAG